MLSVVEWLVRIVLLVLCVKIVAKVWHRVGLETVIKFYAFYDCYLMEQVDKTKGLGASVYVGVVYKFSKVKNYVSYNQYELRWR